MNWRDDEGLRSRMGAFLTSSSLVKDSVVGSGVFNHRGIEIAAHVEWVQPDLVEVTDSSEGWTALWAEGLVRTNPTATELERFEAVAKRMRIGFDRKRKCFSHICELKDLGDVVTRVAVASTIVSGWTFVLMPHRDTSAMAGTTRIIEQVERLGHKQWRTEQNVRIAAKDMAFLARATLLPKGAPERLQPVAVVPLSDDAEDVKPRICAWLYTTSVPIVFLATPRNYEEAANDIADKPKARVVRRARVNDTAKALLESAEAVVERIAS